MRNPRRVAVLTASCATALVGGYVAAPAMSLEPYHPDPVEFELDSPSATPMSGPSPAVISPAIKAPKRFNIVGLSDENADRFAAAVVESMDAGHADE